MFLKKKFGCVFKSYNTKDETPHIPWDKPPNMKKTQSH